MFATTLLRIAGWTHIVLVAAFALVAFVGGPLVPVPGGPLAGLVLGPLNAVLVLLYGSAAGAVLIALADLTEDVRRLRLTVAPADERRGLPGILRLLEPPAPRDPTAPRKTPGASGSFGSGGTASDS